MTPRSIGLNLPAVLAFAVFWIGGVQGYGANAPWLLAPMIALIGAAGWFWRHESATWRIDLAHLGRIDALFAAAFAAALLALTWPRLTQDLWSDAVYNASLATRHAQLALYFVRDHAPDMWARIAAVDVRLVIWAMQASTLVAVALVFVAAPMVIGRWPWALAAFWALALVGVRTLTSADHGLFADVASPVLQGVHPEQDPHPTLRLAPLWASSAVFGPTPLGYRLAGFLAYLAAMLAFFVGLRRTKDIWTSALAVTALATVPVFWHTAYLVEASIWTALAGACAFAIAATPSSRTPLAAAALVVALLAWMRAPAFLALIPLVAAATVRLAAGPVPRADLVATALGVALALAGAVSAVLNGSPVASETPPMTQLLDALTTHTPWIALAATVGLIPFFFVGAALRMETATGAILTLAVFAYLLAAVAVFYGPVKPLVWGLSRYQAEIAVPAIAAGVIAFAVAAAPGALNFRGRTAPASVARLAPAAALAAMIAANLFAILTFDANKRTTLAHPLPGQTVKSEAEYAIATAFDIAAAPTRTYYVGIWYGGFQGILQGLSAADAIAFAEFNERHRSGWSVNAEGLIADPDVDAVIVEADAPFGVGEALQRNGWRYKTVTHPRSGLVLYVYLRPGR